MGYPLLLAMSTPTHRFCLAVASMPPQTIDRRSSKRPHVGVDALRCVGFRRRVLGEIETSRERGRGGAGIFVLAIRRGDENDKCFIVGTIAARIGSGCHSPPPPGVGSEKPNGTNTAHATAHV